MGIYSNCGNSCSTPVRSRRTAGRETMMISSGITHYPVGLTAPPTETRVCPGCDSRKGLRHRHATGCERMVSHTLQTHQDPMLLLPWLCSWCRTSGEHETGREMHPGEWIASNLEHTCSANDCARQSPACTLSDARSRLPCVGSCSVPACCPRVAGAARLRPPRDANGAASRSSPLAARHGQPGACA